MGYFYWNEIPRKADDSTRIAAFVAAMLAAQDELSELNDVNIPAPANGQVLTYETATSKWIAAAGAGDGDQSWARYLPTARYNPSPLFPHWFAAWGLAGYPNYILACPFPVPTSMTFDRISIQITTGGAGNCRLGIYNNTNGYPSSLVLDAGQIDVTAPGVKAIVINQVLPAGLFWLVILLGIGCSITASGSNGYLCLIGTTDGLTPPGGYFGAQAYGALPDPFPGAIGTNPRAPGIMLRRSA